MQADGDVIITSDGIMELRRLPRSMVVVGGGIIGIEYASMFASLGVQVRWWISARACWNFSTGRSLMN